MGIFNKSSSYKVLQSVENLLGGKKVKDFRVNGYEGKMRSKVAEGQSAVCSFWLQTRFTTNNFPSRLGEIMLNATIYRIICENECGKLGEFNSPCLHFLCGRITRFPSEQGGWGRGGNSQYIKKRLVVKYGEQDDD